MENTDIAAKIISPCIKECKVKNNICIGCGRNLYQIQNWLNYSHEVRSQIMKELYERQRK